MDHVFCNDKKIQFDLKQNIQQNIYNKYLKNNNKSSLDTPQVFDFYIESNAFKVDENIVQSKFINQI